MLTPALSASNRRRGISVSAAVLVCPSSKDAHSNMNCSLLVRCSTWLRILASNSAKKSMMASGSFAGRDLSAPSGPMLIGACACPEKRGHCSATVVIFFSSWWTRRESEGVLPADFFCVGEVRTGFEGEWSLSVARRLFCAVPNSRLELGAGCLVPPRLRVGEAVVVSASRCMGVLSS